MIAANKKSPSPTTATGDFENHTNDTNSPTSDSQRKAGVVAEQVAKLVQAGHIVYPRRSGDFLVCKYGLSHWCLDHAELQHFAIQLGVS
jgi:hypothetical protein